MKKLFFLIVGTPFILHATYHQRTLTENESKKSSQEYTSFFKAIRENNKESVERYLCHRYKNPLRYSLVTNVFVAELGILCSRWRN